MHKVSTVIILTIFHNLPIVLSVFLDSLRGVRYRNETVHDTLSHASMAGGMELYIDGSGMDEQSYLNTVLFESVDTPDSDFAGPAQDIDD